MPCEISKSLRSTVHVLSTADTKAITLRSYRQQGQIQGRRQTGTLGHSVSIGHYSCRGGSGALLAHIFSKTILFIFFCNITKDRVIKFYPQLESGSHNHTTLDCLSVRPSVFVRLSVPASRPKYYTYNNKLYVITFLRFLIWFLEKQN